MYLIDCILSTSYLSLLCNHLQLNLIQPHAKLAIAVTFCNPLKKKQPKKPTTETNHWRNNK